MVPAFRAWANRCSKTAFISTSCRTGRRIISRPGACARSRRLPWWKKRRARTPADRGARTLLSGGEEFLHVLAEQVSLEIHMIADLALAQRGGRVGMRNDPD